MLWIGQAAKRRHFVAGVFVVGLAAAGAASAGGGLHVVSQRGREFQPHEIAINRNDTLEIVNDDGDLLHHAYVESDDFNFDSGDQAPGSKTDVVFTKTGVFTILCGIHPKMKLVVHVN